MTDFMQATEGGKTDQVADAALKMLRIAADLAATHHAFTRGKMDEYEATHRKSNFADVSGYQMAMTFALARFADGDFEGAVMMAQAAREVEQERPQSSPTKQPN